MQETSHGGDATIDRNYHWIPIDATIDRNYHWIPIDANAPLGTKVQLINKRDGVATYGQIFSHNSHWTHWAPLPTFKKD